MKFKIITKEEQAKILTDEYIKCGGWGHFLPATAVGAFGARLIMDDCGLSAVAGRVGWYGDSDPVTDMFVEKNLTAKLYKFIKLNDVSSSSSDIIYGESGDYRLLATPNGSYGYVYISVWRI